MTGEGCDFMILTPYLRYVLVGQLMYPPLLLCLSNYSRLLPPPHSHYIRANSTSMCWNQMYSIYIEKEGKEKNGTFPQKERNVLLTLPFR